MKNSVIWMLHSVEDDSPRTAASDLYRNLTVPPARLGEFIRAARDAGREFISLSDMLSGREGIVITIDDGLRNIYTTAFPLFRRLDVPFAFFVATDLIEHGFRNCPYAQMDGMMILLDHVRSRGGDFGKLFRRYRRYRKLLPFLDGRKVMRFILGYDVDYESYRRENVCTPAELREMADSGICEIGSHTVHHVHMDRTRNREAELVDSKSAIEAWTGRPCRYFSYPYGHSDARSIELVRRHFEAAVTDVTVPPFKVTESSDRHLLPRIICTRGSSVKELIG